MTFPSRLRLAPLLILLAACGGSSDATPSSPGTPDATTAVSTTPGADAAGSDDGGVDAPDDSSGNPFPIAPPADGGGVLQAHVQVNGNHGVCGACDVVLAQVTGGTQPYTYVWSNPSWQGPGPFQLCPASSTSVSVTVTDSSANSGELQAAAQTAQDTASIDCVVSDASADGSTDAGPLHGCTAGAGSGTPEAGTNDAGQVECTQNEVEGGVAWLDGGAVASIATPLGYTLLAGHSYQVSYDRLLPIELGNAVKVEIYGSTEPDVCKADQLLFTLNLDGSIFNWHQSYCFTPDRDYAYGITNVYIQGVLTYINPLSVSTVCDSCTQ
jgi:hypothetical protein